MLSGHNWYDYYDYYGEWDFYDYYVLLTYRCVHYLTLLQLS